MNPVLHFWLGALLARLARHPLAAALHRASHGRAARNAIVLVGCWGLLFIRYGEFWAAFFTPLLALYLSWRPSDDVPDAAASRAASAAPAFDEAAFIATLTPLPDAELRRMADGITAALRGSQPIPDRPARVRERQLLYRALDERRAARQGKGSAPPRKGP